jgi:hypothetical protein
MCTKLKTGSGIVGYRFRADLVSCRFLVGKNKIEGDPTEMDEIIEIEFNTSSDIDVLIKNLEKLSKKMKDSEQLAVCA